MTTESSFYDGYRGIEDYGLIGDGRSAALVSVDGSIDWLCWPKFDSVSIFAALLSRENGGRWQISPREPFKASRKYLNGTNVLETTFKTSKGVIRLTDFMPVSTEAFKQTYLTPDHELIRIVDGLEGEAEISVHFDPRPEYASVRPKIATKGRLGLRLGAGRGSVGLHSRFDYSIGQNGAVAAATVRAGERLPFSLTYVTGEPSVLPNCEDAGMALKRTIDWWQAWSHQCSYRGPYREAVSRSALVLKLLSYAPSGAFVAAATTSLPEQVGGRRNYDYRYCWLRDASLTIRALCGAGYDLEAKAFGDWMLHATRLTQPKLMVMYDVYGKIVRPERELRHLSGYRNSRPVRIGNMAREQAQMDIYGEVICGSARLHKNKEKPDREAAQSLIDFGRYVCDHWREPDAGIWEPRDKPVLHTHSLLLCWVALEELIGLSDNGVLEQVPMEWFRRVRDEIRGFIERDAWDANIQSYCSEPGTTKIDATLLLMAHHNFDEASSIRMRATYQRIKAELGAGGPLLYRYREQNEAGTKSSEGAFGICGFWAAEYLAMGGGTLQDAEDTFQTLLRYANDVGLYAEEVDPVSGRAIGNFPQAFTHVGLISAALALERRREQQSELDKTGTSCSARENS